MSDANTSPRPRVVIVGGGFGGIHAAHALRSAAVDVTVIDRTNHSVFQPLLYQVASAGLSADEIAPPIRLLLRRQANAHVLMAEVTGIDTAQGRVLLGDRAVPYDYLVLATGARYTYFGHDEWAERAPSLKTIADAVRIRRQVLSAFEQAELESDPARIQELLTFVLVGAGPTGVELAGALAELAQMLAPEFRHANMANVRIVLIDAGARILATFPEGLSLKAQRALERKGVQVRHNARVTVVDDEGVVAGGERIKSRNVFWTAGVVATPAGSWLGAPTDKAGRVQVLPDLSVPGQPNVFVIGDAMTLTQKGEALPGVAQVAMQQGDYVGNLIARQVAGEARPRPFSYFDKGNLATVGRRFAVADLGWLRFSGFFAWLLWLLVHITYLASLRNQLQVLLSWAWAYLTYQRNVRVLTPVGWGGSVQTVGPAPATLPAAAPTTPPASAEPTAGVPVAPTRV